MYKELTQKILDLLKADATINASVKTFYFGRHDIRKAKTTYPFIDCKWRGGPVDKTKSGAVITRRKIDFFIRIVHKHFKEDVAEKLVMDISERIETVLDGNATLDGLCEEHRIFECVSDVVTTADYSIVAAMTQIKVKRS